MPRYLVGIDLGTTHTVVAFADTEAPKEPTHIFEIDQLVAPGEVAPRPLLPSMRFHPAPGEIAASDRVLPWDTGPDEDPVPEAFNGALAQELGSKVPGRLVTSAKSWLSHTSVDRTAPILPWGASEEIPRVSPLDASAGYLRHVRHAWNHRFPEQPLERQDIVLTVPASFDEVARRLTVEAARLAGLPRVRLLEEPQSACYDWLERHADELEQALAGVDSLLVCDVGGGTTDLTLIRIDRGSRAPRLERIGVGEHLMLGGDNMDLALAHVAEQRLMSAGTRLGAGQLSQLVQQCRGAKERLLARDAPDTAKVTLLGAGSRLIGQARSTELSREEVEELLVDGFFPEIDPGERPKRSRAGIVEFGLPYAADPAVTRHLAAFLADHTPAPEAGETEPASGGSDSIRPDAVLLNGGVFHGETLTERFLQVLTAWRGERTAVLHNDHPDLAVARGAVAYGRARRGEVARIGGGSARGYFLLVEEDRGRAERAVCLLPRGTVEGREQRLTDRVFSLRLGQPVAFSLMTSTSDRGGHLGELVDMDRENFRRLPPLSTVLESSAHKQSGTQEVPVQLAATLTDIGTLEIHCMAMEDAPADVGRRWRMEFQLRGQGNASSAVSTLPATFPQAAARIARAYGARTTGVGPKEIRSLQRDLEKSLGRRGDWDTGLLRELFGVLWEGAKRRRRSADHERIWLNLVGFCLRPGYGHPLDDWRLKQLWSIYEQGIEYRKEARNWAEWWTLWRRVAGGLDKDQQLRILDDIEGRLGIPGKRGAPGAKHTGQDEIIRLAASLERLPRESKARVGERLLRAGRRPADAAQRWWALGRLGTRIPLYGNVHDCVPKELAAEWLEALLGFEWKGIEPAAFAATQLARLSGDRERDLDPDSRQRLVDRLRAEKASQTWIDMVQQVTELDSADQSRVFGESLPPGLRLVS